jgi:phosphoenolpyruvate phosphomutase
MNKKKVYMVMATEIVHHVHIGIIEQAAALGELIVGVYSDKVLLQLNRTPFLTQENRMSIFSGLKGVSRVVLQDELDYEKNLRLLKPDYVIHGDNWKNNFLKLVRERVIQVLSEWNGELVEFPYTADVEIDKISENVSKQGFLPEIRRRKLNYLLKNKDIIRILEAHNGLTGLIVERAQVVANGEIRQFDGIWVSSLCDSTAKGKPDIELVDHSSRLKTIQEILEVTSKPIILDGDSGGLIDHFVHNLASIERIGVSAIIIEDKIGLKQNSLFSNVEQEQDSIEGFCRKISAGKKVILSKDFRIIARIESLILKKGLDDALIRAKEYIAAGVDGIMIHSNQKTPDEILSFCDKFSEFASVPLVVVPTTYNTITEDELVKRGVKVVIYANHLIRSAFPVMLKTAETILAKGRAYEAESMCMPIKEILTLIPS